MPKALKIANLTLALGVCIFLAAGCSGRSKALKQAKEDTIIPAQLQPIDSSFEYKLGDLDQLEIKVWEGVGKLAEVEPKAGQDSEEYRISRGDTLSISVWQWDDLNKDVIVRPDGRLSFPLVGEIIVEGLTLIELDKAITDKLKDYIKYPEVSIMVKEFGKSKFGAIKDFPQQITIRPDGRISFPFIGDIFVRGRTVADVGSEIRKKLSGHFSAPEVYLNLVKFGGKRVVVLGEVSDPGVFMPVNKARLLDVIAMAGGYTKDSALGSVILVRVNSGKPKAEKINLAKIMRGQDLSKNVYIEADDIIYVPRTPITNISYFLQQLLGPLQSSGTATSSIKTIRQRTSPFLYTTTTISP